MDADGRIELRLRRAALQRHGKPLNDLPRVRANHVAADDAVSSSGGHPGRGEGRVRCPSGAFSEQENRESVKG
jgi:hypothetical protein